MMRTQQWVGRLAALALSGAVVAYGAYTYNLRTHPRSELMACAQVEPWVLGWPCRLVFEHWPWTTEEVDEFNAQAGARYAAEIENQAEAERMLKVLLARGVDINANGVRASSRAGTALHAAVLDKNPAAVRLLLKHGARTDIKDKQGLTPLQFAQFLQTSSQSKDAKLDEIIQVLDKAKAEKPPSAS